MDHLTSIDETYFEHMKHALYISWCASKISFFSFVHAVFPFWCIRTAGNQTIDLYEYVKKRRGENDSFMFTL